MEMTTKQLLVRLPEEVADRLKSVVPPRQRNKFMTELVVAAIEKQERKLAAVAAQVTQEEQSDSALTSELRDWDSVAADGIEASYGDTGKA